MKLPGSEKELAERIELNDQRLTSVPCCGIDEVFLPPDCGWTGDKEGRVIPCMEQMLFDRVI